MAFAHRPALRPFAPVLFIASLLLSACAAQAPSTPREPSRPVGVYPPDDQGLCGAYLAELKSGNNEASDGALYDLNDPAIQERLTRPTISSAPAPVYPPNALSSGQRGEVLLGGIIERGGRMSNPRVLLSARVRGFDEAAFESFRQWIFQPARVDGKYVRSYYCTRIRFNLSG
jgi:TonB family protein